MAQQFRIGDKAPQGLNIRSAPVVKESTKLAVLPMGHLVSKLAESTTAGWWEVSTTLNGTGLTGFVNSAFLVPADTFVPATTANRLSAVHLKTGSAVVRGSTDRRAFALNEPGQRSRNPAAPAATRVTELTAIIDWLDVENQPRYKPTTVNTFCNIYAYDYCFLSGVYLPRVWWTSSAIEKLKAGQEVSPVYGQTIVELNANSLFNWLKEHGQTFGWTRSFDPTQLQNAANEGRVVILCAQNRQLNRSGHICPVVPETATLKAKRTGATVVTPLQSQAGRTNLKYFIRTWWTADTFSEFGFWINAS